MTGPGAILAAVTTPGVAETLDITSEATELARARAWIASALERHDVPREHRVALVTAAGELCANAIKHAYAGAPGHPIHLTVRVGSTLEEVSRRLIEATLAECGSKRKAADMLGISLKTLYNRLAAYKANEPAGEDDDGPAKPSTPDEHHRRAPEGDPEAARGEGAGGRR